MRKRVIIAQTQREAESLKEILGDEYADWETCGVGGALYSTPHEIIFRGRIELDGRAWEWLVKEVHLWSVESVRWV